MNNLEDKILSIVRELGRGDVDIIEGTDKILQLVTDFSLEKDKEIQLLVDENDMLEQDFIQLRNQRDELLKALKELAENRYSDHILNKSKQLIQKMQ